MILLTGCKQPNPFKKGSNERRPRECLSGDYCLCRVFGDAQKRCLAKHEGWRWGLAEWDPATGKDKGIVA